MNIAPLSLKNAFSSEKVATLGQKNAMSRRSAVLSSVEGGLLRGKGAPLDERNSPASRSHEVTGLAGEVPTTTIEVVAPYPTLA